MKIMMISSGYYPDSCGGVEVMTQNLSEELVRRGHRIVVVYSKEEFKKDEEYWYNGVKIIKMCPEILRKSGEFSWCINRYLQMYNYFNKKKIRKLIIQEKPDIIHVHMPRIISYVVYQVAKEEKIPTIATLHEYYSLWNYNPFLPMEYITTSKPTLLCNLLRRCQKKAVNQVVYVLSPFDSVIEKYQEEGYFLDSKVKEIKNALYVDIEKCKEEIECKRKILRDRKVRRFLIIGRLIQFKGIEETLEAFFRWKEENVELVIAGVGPLEGLIKSYCKQDKRIRYVGFVKDEQKNDLFRNTDVLLFLVSEIETFGLVCLEGYSFGLPTIATDTGATRRIVDNGETGVRIESINIYTIQEAMKTYLDFSEWEKQMEYCVKKLEKFSFKGFIEKHLKVYEKAVGKEEKEIK